MHMCQVFMALDLELQNDKIIQVGVAYGSWDHYDNNSIETNLWYVDPNESITEYIQTLTGITDDDIKNKAQPHEVIAKEIDQIYEKYNIYVNPITWGGGDSYTLLKEFKDRNIEFHRFGRRWIDIKTWFTYDSLANFNTPYGGLKKTMHKYGLKFIGEPHRADVDAYNTLRLFFRMLEKRNKINILLKFAKDIDK